MRYLVSLSMRALRSQGRVGSFDTAATKRLKLDCERRGIGKDIADANSVVGLRVSAAEVGEGEEAGFVGVFAFLAGGDMIG